MMVCLSLKSLPGVCQFEEPPHKNLLGANEMPMLDSHVGRLFKDLCVCMYIYIYKYVYVYYMHINIYIYIIYISQTLIAWYI